MQSLARRDDDKKKQSSDSGTIYNSCCRLTMPGQTVELRALGVPTGRGYSRTIFGYYDDIQKLAKAAENLSGRASGVYTTMNPIEPALLARANNRCRIAERNDSLTGDSNIIGCNWLLVDTDPVRPTKISSSDTEHDLALARCREIRDALAARGWPDPVEADYRTRLGPMASCQSPIGNHSTLLRKLRPETTKGPPR